MSRVHFANEHLSYFYHTDTFIERCTLTLHRPFFISQSGLRLFSAGQLNIHQFVTMVRVHQHEFNIIREYYQIHGNSFAIIVRLVKRRLLGADHNIPQNVLELWRGGLSDEQLRRRVRDAISRRIGM